MGLEVWSKKKWGKEEEELSDWRRKRRRRRRKKQKIGRYPMGPTNMFTSFPQIYLEYLDVELYKAKISM